MLFAAVLTGWYVGFVIGAVVIALVVVLVATILVLARRIGVQAAQIEAALEESRVNTWPLWQVDKVTTGLRSITRSAATARSALGG
ncbi:MAG: hypothetical protein ACRD0U_01030 [Acidimicrobiales bacterium]